MEGKQLIQAAVLVALVLFGVLYSYIEFVEAPLKHEQDALELKITRAKTQAATDGEQLHKLVVEEQAELKNQSLDDLLERIKETLPITPQVDCPYILSKLLRQHGITRSKVAITGYYPMKELNGGMLQKWDFSCPDVRPFILGEAIAEMENKLPMAQLSEFHIGRNVGETTVRADCSFQFVTFR